MHIFLKKKNYYYHSIFIILYQLETLEYFPMYRQNLNKDFSKYLKSIMDNFKHSFRLKNVEIKLVSGFLFGNFELNL